MGKKTLSRIVRSEGRWKGRASKKYLSGSLIPAAAAVAVVAAAAAINKNLK